MCRNESCDIIQCSSSVSRLYPDCIRVVDGSYPGRGRGPLSFFSFTGGLQGGDKKGLLREKKRGEERGAAFLFFLSLNGSMW